MREARGCGAGTAVGDDAFCLQCRADLAPEFGEGPVALGGSIEDLPGGDVAGSWDVPAASVLVQLAAVLASAQGVD